MLLQQVNGVPLPPSQVSELPIPRQFEAILMMCLEKDPAKRPPSAVDLESMLAAVPSRDPWTTERAQTWWETNVPDVLARIQA